VRGGPHIPVQRFIFSVAPGFGRSISVTPSVSFQGSLGSSTGTSGLFLSRIAKAVFVRASESLRTALNASRKERASASTIASTHQRIVVISSLSSGTLSRSTRSLVFIRHACAALAVSPFSNLATCFDVSPYSSCIHLETAEKLLPSSHLFFASTCKASERLYPSMTSSSWVCSCRSRSVLASSK
jgi:hypothetical protein